MRIPATSKNDGVTSSAVNGTPYITNGDIDALSIGGSVSKWNGPPTMFRPETWNTAPFPTKVAVAADSMSIAARWVAASVSTAGDTSRTYPTNRRSVSKPYFVRCISRNVSAATPPATRRKAVTANCVAMNPRFHACSNRLPRAPTRRRTSISPVPDAMRLGMIAAMTSRQTKRASSSQMIAGRPATGSDMSNGSATRAMVTSATASPRAIPINASCPRMNSLATRSRPAPRATRMANSCSRRRASRR